MTPRISDRRIIGKVFSGGTIPTSTGVLYLMHPVSMSGTPTEGGTPTLSVDTSRSFACYFIGPKAPVADEYYVCSPSRQGIWFAERMKTHTTGTVSYPCGSGGTACTNIPSTLTLTLSSSGCGIGLYNATLTYQSTPSWASTFGLGSNTFMSTSSFVDNDGETYYYFFSCLSNVYRLRCGYQTNSIYGSPYITANIFTWVPGVGSNTCSPFSMVTLFTNGSGGCTSAHLTG